MQRERQNDGRIKGKKKKNSDEYYYYPDAPQGQGEGDPDVSWSFIQAALQKSKVAVSGRALSDFLRQRRPSGPTGAD